MDFRADGTASARDLARANATVTLDKRDEFQVFGTLARTGLARGRKFGFVGFDHKAVAAKGRLRTCHGSHSLADTMGHEPSGLVGNPKHAGELMAGNALLAGAEKVVRVQPRIQGDFGAFKDRSDRH